MKGPSDRRGFFLVLEGGEGAGKGSIASALEAWMTHEGIDYLRTREPGGTPEGAALRAALVERGSDWDPVSELLLMAADRRQHVQRVILPALEQGKVVLCDRFASSTEAYQGAGRQLPIQLIKELRQITVGDVEPDRVFLLDIDPTVGLRRSQKRLDEAGSKEDLFERLDLAFHQRVRQSFLEQMARESGRWSFFDASEPLQDVIAKVIREFSSQIQAVRPLRTTSNT